MGRGKEGEGEGEGVEHKGIRRAENNSTERLILCIYMYTYVYTSLK